MSKKTLPPIPCTPDGGDDHDPSRRSDRRPSRGGAGSPSGAGSPGQGAAGYFVAGAGIASVTDMTKRARALERDRLDEYAQLLVAAMNVSGSVELAIRSLRAELATALHLSEYTVERELDIAHTVTVRYPGVRQVLGDGLISLSHVKIICDAGSVIGSTPEALLKHALYEEAVLAFAIEETPGRLQPIAKRLAEQFAEVSLEERHETARRRRCVEVYPSEDGMAELYALLPAETAYAIRDRIRRISREIWQTEQTVGATDTAGRGGAAETSEAEANSRSLGEVRADTFAEILLAGNPYTATGPSPDTCKNEGSAAKFSTPAFQAHLQITVPVAALQGGPEAMVPRPVSELAGYGPIATGVAAMLLETSTDIYRVDHDTFGQVLQVDKYKPTKEMRRLLAARDQHCRFPGCTRVAITCEIDHTIAWEEGGTTTTSNLEHLCKAHHTLKHHSAWVPVLDETGTVTWTSPSGNVYEDKPAGRGYRRHAPVPPKSLRPLTAGQKRRRNVAPEGEDCPSQASDPGIQTNHAKLTQTRTGFGLGFGPERQDRPRGDSTVRFRETPNPPEDDPF